MKKKFIIISAFLIIIFSVTIFAEASNSPEIRIYNADLISSNLDATYIEGDITRALGQQIIVKNGIRTVAVRSVPNTGRAASFRIKIPSSSINADGPTILRVYAESTEGSGMSNALRVRITYKARKDQKIRTDKKNYSLNIPGDSGRIKAKASSGSKVTFESSDPKVVKVDNRGRITPKSGGTADIIISQAGDSRYNKTVKKVTVKVTELDAYTVVFHSGDDKTRQIIETGKDVTLDANTFTSEGHEFLGWADEDGGLVNYTDAEAVRDLAGKGEEVNLYAVWSGDGINAAIAWALKIAADDSFTYGGKPETNRLGCYFCGTNQKNKPKGYEKTYVCLTFIGAAFAHGAEDPEILYACQHSKMPIYENDKNFSRFSCWTKLGTCQNMSLNDMLPGDIVIKWSDKNDNNGHVWMYLGDGKLVEASSAGGEWTPESIAVKDDAASRLARYGRQNNKNYVMRYTGS